MAERHRWMVYVPYEVTAEDARRIQSREDLGGPQGLAGDEAPAPGDPRPFLGMHNVVHDLVAVGCFTCEQPYSDEVEAAGCPGEPGAKLAYVDAAGRDLHPNEVVDRAAAPTRFGGVGRNEPCPCGSGQKFKRCHGSASRGAGT